MKASIKLMATAILVVGGLSSIGCAGRGDRPTVQERYADLVDPCWPERYNAEARKPVMQTMGAQVANGRDIDHTLWNYHFEQGTEVLNPAGRAKIDYLMRRRPVVDNRIVLQTARDLSFDPTKADHLANSRAELDAKRNNSIQQYVTASTSGRGVSVDVTIKDPADLYMDATGPSNAVRGLTGLFSSGISGVASGGVAGAGGGAAPTTAAAAGGAAPQGAPAPQTPR